MKRGEIHTAAESWGLARKPRPVLIIQADRYAADLVMVAPITGTVGERPEIRPLIVADRGNGLAKDSEVMLDLLMPVRREKFGRKVGEVSRADMARIEQALLAFLGF